MEQSHHAIQPNTNVHNLLKSLNECPKEANEKSISKLIKEKLGIFSLVVAAPHEKIYESAKTLMKDVVRMSSFSDAQMELAGAIKGLNILLKNESNINKQKLIRDEIKNATQFEQEIIDIFAIKEAIALKKDLKVEINSDLITHFGIIQSLFGRKRKLNSTIIQEFIQLWNDKENQQFLKDFLKTGKKIREASVESLENEKFSYSLKLKDNEPFLQSHMMLTVYCEKNKCEHLLKLIDHIVNNRCIITNTQVNEDGFYLAFNSKATDAWSIRHKDIAKNAKRQIDGLEQELKELKKSSESESSDEIAKLSNKLEFLKQGYVSRIGLCLEISRWEPSIGPQDPIQPLRRTIGFAIEEGDSAKSITPLDFASILGKENLNLNLNERIHLSDLLDVCEKAFELDDDVFDKMQISKETPKEIQELFDKFNKDSLPHLKQLTENQKKDLVKEALIFIKSVNQNLFRDLLTL